MLKSNGNKAVMIGATGLVGSSLLHLLLADKRFSEIVVLGRRSLMMEDTKLKEIVVDFDQPDKWKDLVQGDIAFSCLGTTLKTAGSKEAQRKVDYTYQLQFAKAARENQVPQFSLVSAAGANANSSVFYSQMKGQLDDAVTSLDFDQLRILRPGFLKGLRKEFRLGEVLALPPMELLKFIPGLRQYRPIDCWIVAKAMINSAFESEPKTKIYTLGEIFEVGK